MILWTTEQCTQCGIVTAVSYHFKKNKTYKTQWNVAYKIRCTLGIEKNDKYCS